MHDNKLRAWLTPQEVGLLCGFSASFIRGEIHARALPATLIPSRAGKLGRWKIHRDDAVAYAVRLGVWREARTT